MAKKTAIDGFVPRRSPGVIGEAKPSARSTASSHHANAIRRREIVSKESATRSSDTPATTLAPVQQHGLTRQDVDESLREIDNQDNNSAAKHKRRGGVRSHRRRIIKWVMIALLLGILLTGGFLAAKALIASNSVFKGDVFGLIHQKKLRQDEHGRTNILVLGTSEDDPDHDGAHLTDTIMVLSIDQTKKDAHMFNLPRDMPVKYGMACDAGYFGKINAYFNCVNDDWSSSAAETERQEKTREFIGDIVGMDIQYSAHVNYSVMRDVVKAIDGITVMIEGSNGDPGVMDGNFDWKCKGGDKWASLATMKKICPPNGHFIDYPNGPAHLDAEHALYLAQARGHEGTPSYGLGRSNFDREQNQQKIVKAIKEKSMSSGTLANPIKVSGLIDAIGGNLRTNFETSEISTLVSLAQKIPNESIQSLDFEKDGILNGNATPVAGDYDFTDLQAYIKKKVYATGISREDPHVIVLNGSGIAGAAQVESDKLSALGITVDAIGNMPADMTVSTNTVYQVAKTAKTNTAKKLSELYGSEPKVVTALPGVVLGEETDYVVILMKANTSATGSTNAE